MASRWVRRGQGAHAGDFVQGAVQQLAGRRFHECERRQLSCERQCGRGGPADLPRHPRGLDYRGGASLWPGPGLDRWESVGSVVDLYRATPQWRVVVPFKDLAFGIYTMEIRPQGTEQTASNGTTVVVDGFRAVRPLDE